jgi:hypothetical protein
LSPISGNIEWRGGEGRGGEGEGGSDFLEPLSIHQYCKQGRERGRRWWTGGTLHTGDGPALRDGRGMWKGKNTRIKKKIKFSSYIRKFGTVAKSYMRKGFLIYEESRKYFPIYCMRRPFVIFDFATAPLWISLYMRKILFYFLSVYLWLPDSRGLFNIKTRYHGLSLRRILRKKRGECREKGHRMSKALFWRSRRRRQ